MLTIQFVLLIAALICFLLATANIPTRISVGWLGLAFWVLSLLIK